MAYMLRQYSTQRWSPRHLLLLVIILVLGTLTISRMCEHISLWLDRVNVETPERQATLDRCRKYGHRTGSEGAIGSCCPGVPCVYQEEVDLRLIVIVYNRGMSLEKILNSISRLELDGDRASLDIWVDISPYNIASRHTLRVAQEFRWHAGPVNVHIQLEHVGIYGQWIDSWRPRPDSKELALILEDDVDISPYAYRWLKAAYAFYGSRPDIGGISLYEGAIVHMPNLPADELVFLHQRLGTQGFAPNPKHWHRFQDWYHQMKNHPTFHPYVERDATVTNWYRNFEKQQRNNTMWEMWYIYYADTNDLWTLYSNIGAYRHTHMAELRPDTYLAFHRAADGLHFKHMEIGSVRKLLLAWEDVYVRFPEAPIRYSYNGTRILPML